MGKGDKKLFFLSCESGDIEKIESTIEIGRQTFYKTHKVTDELFNHHIIVIFLNKLCKKMIDIEVAKKIIKLYLDKGVDNTELLDFGRQHDDEIRVDFQLTLPEAFYYKGFKDIAAMIEGFPGDPVSRDGIAIRVYQKLLEAFSSNDAVRKSTASKLAKRYRRSDSYKANASILLMSQLFSTVRDHNKPMLTIDEKVIKYTQNDEVTKLSMAEIAQRICDLQSFSSRNHQYIAIGVTRDGVPVVTSNYYTPVIFRVSDVLEPGFDQVYEARKQMFKTISTNKQIHAETMLAALKDVLGITNILVIDAEGRRMQNCVFCANYLHSAGFCVDTHSSKIMDYKIPTSEQIEQVLEWFRYLSSNFSREGECEYIGPDLSVIPDEEVSRFGSTIDPGLRKHLGINDNDQALTDYAIEHYPSADELEVPRNTKSSYQQAESLASPDEIKISRISLGGTGEKKEAVAKDGYRNTRVTLFHDAGLRKSKNPDREGRLSPVIPDSPRSVQLCKKVDSWFDARSVRSFNAEVSNGQIILTRELPNIRRSSTGSKSEVDELTDLLGSGMKLSN